jgi:hypothetical protein
VGYLISIIGLAIYSFVLLLQLRHFTHRVVRTHHAGWCWLVEHDNLFARRKTKKSLKTRKRGGGRKKGPKVLLSALLLLPFPLRDIISRACWRRRVPSQQQLKISPQSRARECPSSPLNCPSSPLKPSPLTTLVVPPTQAGAISPGSQGLGSGTSQPGPMEA